MASDTFLILSWGLSLILVAFVSYVLGAYRIAKQCDEEMEKLYATLKEALEREE